MSGGAFEVSRGYLLGTKQESGEITDGKISLELDTTNFV